MGRSEWRPVHIQRDIVSVLVNNAVTNDMSNSMKIECPYEFIKSVVAIGIEFFNGDRNWNWNLKIGIDPSPDAYINHFGQKVILSFCLTYSSSYVLLNIEVVTIWFDCNSFSLFRSCRQLSQSKSGVILILFNQLWCNTYNRMAKVYGICIIIKHSSIHFISTASISSYQN